MPIPPAGVDQPGAVCCETWFVMADALATLAGETVRDCLGDTCPDFPYYVSHGEPIGGGDYLAVWLASMNVQRNFGDSDRLKLSPTPRASFRIALCQEGYPMPSSKGNKIGVVPSAEEHTKASYFSYGVAEAMYRKVVSQLISKPQSLVGACKVGTIGSLVAQPPALRSARWMFEVGIDMPFG